MRVQGFVFRDECLKFRVSGFVFRVLCSMFRVSCCMFWAWCFVFGNGPGPDRAPTPHCSSAGGTQRPHSLHSHCSFAAPAMERLVIYCQTTGVSAAHATHCAKCCTPCRPLIRAFSGWIRTPPPTTCDGVAALLPRGTSKVDIKLPGKGNPIPHGARPVH